MKILIISPYVPWPLYSGACVRIFNLIKELRSRGHQIFLLAGDKYSTAPPNAELERLCEKIYEYHFLSKNYLSFILRSVFSRKIYPALKFQSKDMVKKINDILSEEKFDLVWVNFSILAEILPDNLKKNLPVILDQHECERLVYQGYIKHGSFMEKMVGLINITRLSNFEKNVYSKIDAVLCVSEAEAELAKKINKNVGVFVVPNGVGGNFFSGNEQLKENKYRIVICGGLGIRRNMDAVAWFSKYIFPKIKLKIDKAEFWIVGGGSSPEISEIGLISGIKVTGEVEDIKKYYKSAAVFVAPYRFGAGTKLKVLEAMASGVPVVSTSAGCMGIDVSDGENILIADNENDFSERVIELLSDPLEAKKIAAAGQNLIKEKYTWKKIIDDLEPEIFKLIDNKRKKNE